MATCQIMSRIKSNYEVRNRHILTRRTPVILRLDGKAFHTYTRGLNKPFDEGLISDMQETAIYLCQNIQGAKCAYTQSDEISILVTDYDDLNTQSWFDYNQSKMVSISASLATGIFNQLRLQREVLTELENTWDSYMYHIKNFKSFKPEFLANFDSRSFNIPKEEVANYFYARQKDAVKNSIAMLAQSLYSHKELHNKNGSEMQEMCFQKGHNWNDLHWSKKKTWKFYY
jgi:tRNA(His) 5'-end guanylyltransferase